MSIGFRVLIIIVGWLAPLSVCLAHSYIARPNHGIRVGPVTVSVRSGHRILPTFRYGGSYYVLGQRGQRYSIHVKNRTRRRLEAVVSVDGRDVITGERSRSFTRRGYVLNSYRFVNITGFRTSKNHVASFRFTSVGNSYARKMGSSWYSIGRIHVAVFRENRPVAYIPRPRPFRRWRNRGGKRRMHGGRAPASKAEKSRDSVSGRSAYRRRRWIRRPPRHRPNLGTAYGQQRYAPARYTTFKRLTSYPSYQLSLRYNNCAGFRRSRICTRWCPCRRWHRRPYYKYKYQRRRYAPPPPH